MTLFEELKAIKDRKTALDFQRLMIENPYIEDLDVELHTRDGDVIVKVTHPEWYDWEFNASQRFVIRTPENDEEYGHTAEEAYHSAMPITLGLKAGYILRDHPLFDDFSIDHEDDSCVLYMTSSGSKQEENPEWGNEPERDGFVAKFAWDVREQGFTPIDEENLPGGKGDCCKTIAEMRNYLDSFER